MRIPFAVSARRRVVVAALASALWCGAAAPARAQSVAASTAPFGAADPVVVAGNWSLAPGAPVFDFGTRHLVIASGAQVVTHGAVLRAGRVTVQATAALIGSVRLETVVGGGPFADGAVLVAGVLDAIGAGAGGDGGEIEIDAAGAITVAATGTLVARPLPGATLRGGEIELVASAGVSILAGVAPLDAGAHEDGQAGGEITLVAFGASAIACGRALRTAGDAGGPVVALAGGALSLTAPLAAHGGPGCVFGYFGWGEGGDVVLAAGADLSVTAPIDVSGSPCFGPAGAFSATAGGSLSCAQLVAAGGYAPSSAYLAAGGDVIVVGGLDAAGRDGFGYAGRGGYVVIEAGGGCSVGGVLAIRGGDDTFDGAVAAGGLSITAGEDVVTATIDAYGLVAGDVALVSTAGDVRTGAVLGGADDHPNLGVGAAFSAIAGRDVVLGAVDLTGSTDSGKLYVQAGRDATLAAVDVGTPAGPTPDTYVAVFAARHVLLGGPLSYAAFAATAPDAVLLAGCRVHVGAAIAPAGGADPGSTVRLVAGDVATIAAPVSAAPAGVVRLTTRLAAPWSPVFAPGGSIAPAPVLVHDPALPPCLATGAAGLSAPLEVYPGAPYTLTAGGPPGAPLFVAVGTALAPAPLGAFGYTQLPPLAVFPLADPGFLGPPLPGSATDAEGGWIFAATVPPGLAGLVLYAEAFFFDVGAPNGLFHQPPATATVFR